MTEGEYFHSTLVANCVFNAFLSYTAIMLNIITILALRKTSSLPKALKTLLLSLAVSDLGVGLLVQPLYIARLVMDGAKWNKMEQNVSYIYITYNNTIYIAHLISGSLFSGASFFGVVTLSADRFLAIHLHLRYQELVTHKRVVAVVISVWVFSASVALICFEWIPKKVPLIFFPTLGVACCIATGLLYCGIYAAVRRHTNQIQATQVPQLTPNGSGEMTNAARLRKTALGTFYVYLVFLVCYIPNFCVILAFQTWDQSTLLWHLQWYALTLVSLNSSLNPLIYCWKMSHIRQAVMDLLRNICPPLKRAAENQAALFSRENKAIKKTYANRERNARWRSSPLFLEVMETDVCFS